MMSDRKANELDLQNIHSDASEARWVKPELIELCDREVSGKTSLSVGETAYAAPS